MARLSQPRGWAGRRSKRRRKLTSDLDVQTEGRHFSILVRRLTILAAGWLEKLAVRTYYLARRPPSSTWAATPGCGIVQVEPAHSRLAADVLAVLPQR